MTYMVSLALPNLPKGAIVQLDGLGAFVNGDSREVSDEEADQFRMHHGVRLTNDSPLTPGFTVLQAFKNSVGITVAVVPAKKSDVDKAEADRLAAEALLSKDDGGVK